MRAFTSLVLVCLIGGSIQAEPPKAIDEALKILEKGLKEAKDPAEKEKIQDAIAALKKIGEAPKVQNELISDYIDNTDKYKGRTLTFRLTYIAGARDPLRTRLGDKGVSFEGKDPKNGAKLVLGLDIPKGLDVPQARGGEEVIVTFTCGGAGKPNTAVSIIRP